MAVFTITYRNPGFSQSLLQRAWTGMHQAFAAHETRRLLAQMDDRGLSDIGVSRAEAGYEADRPIWDVGLR